MPDAWLSPSTVLAAAGLASAGVAAWVDARSKLSDLAARLKILEEELKSLRVSAHDSRESVAELLARQELWERGQPMHRR